MSPHQCHFDFFSNGELAITDIFEIVEIQENCLNVVSTSFSHMGNKFHQKHGILLHPGHVDLMLKFRKLRMRACCLYLYWTTPYISMEFPVTSKLNIVSFLFRAKTMQNAFHMHTLWRCRWKPVRSTIVWTPRLKSRKSVTECRKKEFDYWTSYILFTIDISKMEVKSTFEFLTLWRKDILKCAMKTKVWSFQYVSYSFISVSCRFKEVLRHWRESA